MYDIGMFTRIGPVGCYSVVYKLQKRLGNT